MNVFTPSPLLSFQLLKKNSKLQKKKIGATAFITKPNTYDELRDVMQRFFIVVFLISVFDFFENEQRHFPY